MINLRYHVFSLMAVFAALAIGIVVGSTTVKSGLVDSLRSNVERTEQRIAEVQQENSNLKERDQQLDLLDQEGAQLLAGELVDEPVLWIVAPGVDRDVVDGMQESFDAAGAVSIGRVVLTEAAFSDDGAPAIADVLDSTETDPAELRAALGADIAARVTSTAGFLETPPIPEVEEADDAQAASSDSDDSATAPDDTATDATVVTQDTVSEDTASEDTEVDTSTSVPRSSTTSTSTTTTVPVPPAGPRVDAMTRAQFGDLEESGLVDLRELQSDPLVAGAVVRLVVLEDRASDIDVGSVLTGFVRSLGEDDQDRVLVVSEAGVQPNADDEDDPRPSFVQTIRSSGRLSDVASTVDDSEGFGGWAASVLAVRNGIAGRTGHYGYRDGADSFLPPSPS